MTAVCVLDVFCSDFWFPGSSTSPVNQSSPHAAFEEAATAIAGIDAVVFTTAGIRAHFTKHVWARSFTRTFFCQD